MTDDLSSSVPEHDPDLLASLYLDGEATPDEVAMVEADPELMRRVAELQVVSTQLARPVAPPVGLARLQIDAALAAFSPAGLPGAASARGATAGSATDRAPAAPISLSERRSRRAIPSWLSAAAATLVVLGGIGFGIRQLGTSTGDDSAASDLSNDQRETTLAARTEEATSTTASAEIAAAEGASDTTEAMRADDAGGGDAADSAESEASEEPAAADESTGLADSEPSESDLFYAENGPIPVGSAENTSAAEIFDTFQPLLVDIEKSPCAESEDVLGLEEPIGYAPIIIDDNEASLVLFGEAFPGSDPPSFPAVVIDVECQIILR